MMKPMTWEKAKDVWKKTPNRMIAFEPGVCQHENAIPEHWVLADQWAALGHGFNADDVTDMRDTLKRKND